MSNETKVAPEKAFPAPSQEPVTLTDEQKRDIASNWFSEDWAIKQAMGLMDDYESTIAALREKERV